MLDLMRKHASSWMIKLILGAIIVSFALFFGWSRFGDRSEHGLPEGHAVAKVNDIPIPMELFRFYYDRNLEKLEETFKGGTMPDGFQNFAKILTLQQLIRRQLVLQKIKDLNIEIPDEEVAAAVREDIGRMQGGEFDPVFYREKFLPFFENRYKLNYEELIREDISIGLLDSLMSGINGVKDADQENFQWTFEVASFEPKKLTEEKIIADEEQAVELAQKFISSPSSEWKKLADKNKVELKKIGPVSIAERARILSGRGTQEDFEEIFSLNTNEVIRSPLKRGDSLFVVRLLEKKSSPIAKNETGGASFLNLWIQNELADAKIVNYLQTENQ